MIYKIFLFGLLVIILYCLAAVILRLPGFKAGAAFKVKKAKETHTLSGLMDSAVKTTAKYIPMGVLRQAEMEKALQAANIPVTPKEYLAAAIVRSLLFLLFALPAYLLNPVLALIPAAFAVYTFYIHYTEASRKSDRRKTEIEKELPRFVAYMANSLRSNRNILNLIDTYKANYDSPLTEELAITASDMRTGNQERALQHFESRINSPLLGELVRGMLSSLRGDDMTMYFDNLSYKLSAVWQQRLKEQALKKEPKISLMSYLLFGCAIVSIMVILVVMVQSSVSLFGVGT